MKEERNYYRHDHLSHEVGNTTFLGQENLNPGLKRYKVSVNAFKMMVDEASIKAIMGGFVELSQKKNERSIIRSLMSSTVGARLEKKIARQVKYGFGRCDTCSYATSGLPSLIPMNFTPFERSAEALLTQYFVFIRSSDSDDNDDEDVFIFLRFCFLRFCIFLLLSSLI
nr:hypothetical protein Iba_chr08eCG10930 [Ipomoea batatas]